MTSSHSQNGDPDAGGGSAFDEDTDFDEEGQKTACATGAESRDNHNDIAVHPTTTISVTTMADMKNCIWCRTLTRLIPSKFYCFKCQKTCFRECRRCHRPFPSPKYFTEDDIRCNSCQKKILLEKQKRLEKSN